MRSLAIRYCAILTAWVGCATLTSAFTYQIDDGDPELARGPFQGGAIAWMNSFQVEPAGKTLTSIDIVLKPFGPDTVVHPLTVYLWTDPTNDGDPVDAVVARSAPSSTTPVGTFVNIPIPPLTLSAGSWFFAGGLYARPANDFDAAPVAADRTDPDFPNRSYFATWDNAALADPNNLSAGTIFFGPDNDPQGANYLVRVNAVPEPSTCFLTYICLIGFGAWTRTRP